MPNPLQVGAYKAGLTCWPPGLVLAEVLQRTGGIYETTLPPVPEMQADLRDVAKLTRDLAAG